MVDSHAHLQFFGDEVKDVVARALESGLKFILCPSVDYGDNHKVIEISDGLAGVFPAVGVHPLRLDGSLNLDEIERFVSDDRVVAVGETGLDFLKGGDEKMQIEAFEFHVQLAKRFRKPLIVHTRGVSETYGSSFDVCLEILRAAGVSAVFHSFCWGTDEARRAQDAGFFISISGMVVYSRKVQLCVHYLDIHMTLVETDSPFLSPIRGVRNEPAYVRYVIERVAEIKKLDLDRLAEIFVENFERFFLSHRLKGG